MLRAGAVPYLALATALLAAIILPSPAGGLDPSAASVLAQGSQTTLPGHVLPLIAQATPLAALQAEGAQPLTFSVVLRRADEAGFQAYLQAVADPHSPSYRHFLSGPTDLANRFGPSQQTYDAVLGYLLQSGFTLVRGSPDRLMITVQGTRDLINHVFGTQIRNFQWEGRVVYANTADPSVPTALAPAILGFVGLNNFGPGRHAGGVVPHPPDEVAAAPPAVPAGQATATPQPASISSIQVARAYNADGVRLPDGRPATGAGQTVGLVEFEAVSGENLTNWLKSSAGPCAAPATQAACVQSFLDRMSVTAVGGSASATATLLPTPGPNGANQGEVLLDIVAVMGVAQGANYAISQHCNQFFAPNCPANDVNHAFNNSLLMMLSQLTEKSTVISSSWSLCENTATQADTDAFHSVILNAAGKGISIFFAINDQGNACNGDVSATNLTGYPTGDPYVVAVGGTILTVGSQSEYYSETWWGSGNGGPVQCTDAFNHPNSPSIVPNNWGCGGWGHSELFTAPPWQIPFLTPSPTPARQVPDVVAYAQPGITAWFGSGLSFDYFGTSLASPLWAAGMALVNEARGGSSGPLNPTLYQLKGTDAFHGPGTVLPLTTVPGGGNDFTHLGLGSPNWGAMAALLAPSPTGTPRPTATRTPTPTPTIHPLTQTAIALTGTPTPTIHPLTQTAIVQTATVQALTATATPTIHPLTQTAIVQTATVQALTATATPTIHPLTQTAIAATATVQALTATATPTIHPLTQTAIALTGTPTRTPVRAPTTPPGGLPASGTPGVPAATAIGQTVVYNGAGNPNGVSGTWTRTGSGAFTFVATNTSAAIVPGSIPALTLPTTAGNESGTPLAGQASVCTPVGATPPFTTTCRGTTAGNVLLGAQVTVAFATAGGGTVVSTGQQVAGTTANSLTTAQAQTQAQGTAGFLGGTAGLPCATFGSAVAGQALVPGIGQTATGQTCTVSGAVSGTLTPTGSMSFTLTATVPDGLGAGITPVAVFSTDAGLQAVACAAPAAGAGGTTSTCTGTIAGNALQGSTVALCFTAATPCLLGTVRGPGAGRAAVVVAANPPPLLPPPPPVFLPPPAPLLPPPPQRAGPGAPAAAEVPIIPEAESLVLVALGLGALGGVALRRRGDGGAGR